MQLVLYNDSDKVLDVVKDIEDVKIDGDNIKWHDGELRGIQANFALMPETVTLQKGDTLTADQKSQAVNGDFRPFEAKIDERIKNVEDAVVNVMMTTSKGVPM